jgi:hypothetical protein
MLNSHGLALLIDLERLLDRVCSHSETISADHGPNTSGSPCSQDQACGIKR